MKISKRSGLLATFFFLASLAVPARAEGPPSVADLAAKVQAHYEKVTDLSAAFEQESTVVGSRKKRKAKGVVKFKKPGLMRWDYSEPVEQAFVSDGRKFYYYNATEKFVAVKKLSQAFDSPTPNDFLQGLGRLEQSFVLSAPSEGTLDAEGRSRITLTPKEAGRESYSLTLILEKGGAALWGVAFTDAMGSKTLVQFVGLKENKGLPDSAFNFKTPPGVTEKQEF